jgi:hypothetical protein
MELKNYFAQGELSVIPLDKASVINIERKKSFEPELDASGNIIVGHSETGHHHVLPRDSVAVIATSILDNVERFIIQTFEKPTQLLHQRKENRHEPITLEPNQYYEIRGAREHDVAEDRSIRAMD